MPELGKYAGAVIGAYGISILLVGGLVALSLWRSARVRRALKTVEERAKR